jgi:O-acetyl-ADP-ribose deacetylase (regulator of RNase III)
MMHNAAGIAAGESVPLPRDTLHGPATNPNHAGDLQYAVTSRQFVANAKATDSRAKGFGEISVELDAIEPNQLRQIVQDAIERHLPRDQLDVLLAAEGSERDILKNLVSQLNAAD